MFGIGMSEMVIILAVALLVFGPQKLPEIAKGIAKGLRELRRAGDDLRTSIDLEDDHPASRSARRMAPRMEPPPEEPPPQIPGSALTAGAATAATASPTPASDDAAPPAEAPAVPRWPAPADGTLAQGSLENELAPEGPDAANPVPEAPPGEAKGS